MLSVLGVDIGGTKIAVGPVDREGTQLAPPITALTQTTDADALLVGHQAFTEEPVRTAAWLAGRQPDAEIDTH